MMVRRRALECRSRRQSNQGNVVSNDASELQNPFAINSFAFCGNEARGIGERLEYIEGFVCAVRRKNVELCGFQYELTCRKRLAGFCFRNNNRRTTHTGA